ncbi:hypothetical protein TNCV_575401 [Trichonephila clavipes]|nr:hypothetical protein TNCV_575401 [Trichonephila clavipes]
MGSHVVIFCWINRNPERKDHWIDVWRNFSWLGLHPMLQTLCPAGDGIFQDDNTPILAAGPFQSCLTCSCSSNHLPWPAQSPDLNIIESL